jgi:hypothetical protein
LGDEREGVGGGLQEWLGFRVEQRRADGQQKADGGPMACPRAHKRNRANKDNTSQHWEARNSRKKYI